MSTCFSSVLFFNFLDNFPALPLVYCLSYTHSTLFVSCNSYQDAFYNGWKIWFWFWILYPSFKFSVVKATLQLQMSICPSVSPKAKPLNSLKSSSFIFHPAAFIFHPSSFIIHLSSYFIHPSSLFIHPSFISRLLSFSACFGLFQIL